MLRQIKSSLFLSCNFSLSSYSAPSNLLDSCLWLLTSLGSQAPGEVGWRGGRAKRVDTIFQLPSQCPWHVSAHSRADDFSFPLGCYAKHNYMQHLTTEPVIYVLLEWRRRRVTEMNINVLWKDTTFPRLFQESGTGYGREDVKWSLGGSSIYKTHLLLDWYVGEMHYLFPLPIPRMIWGWDRGGWGQKLVSDCQLANGWWDHGPVKSWECCYTSLNLSLSSLSEGSEPYGIGLFLGLNEIHYLEHLEQLLIWDKVGGPEFYPFL